MLATIRGISVPFIDGVCIAQTVADAHRAEPRSFCKVFSRTEEFFYCLDLISAIGKGSGTLTKGLSTRTIYLTSGALVAAQLLPAILPESLGKRVDISMEAIHYAVVMATAASAVALCILGKRSLGASILCGLAGEWIASTKCVSNRITKPFCAGLGFSLTLGTLAFYNRYWKAYAVATLAAQYFFPHEKWEKPRVDTPLEDVYVAPIFDETPLSKFVWRSIYGELVDVQLVRACLKSYFASVNAPESSQWKTLWIWWFQYLGPSPEIVLDEAVDRMRDPLMPENDQSLRKTAKELLINRGIFVLRQPL